MPLTWKSTFTYIRMVRDVKWPYIIIIISIYYTKGVPCSTSYTCPPPPRQKKHTPCRIISTLQEMSILLQASVYPPQNGCILYTPPPPQKENCTPSLIKNISPLQESNSYKLQVYPPQTKIVYHKNSTPISLHAGVTI